MRQMKYLVFSCLVMYASTSVGADAPTIQLIERSGDGVVTHGDQVVLTGTDFGNGSHAVPLIWDTLDNFSGYRSLEHGDDVPVGSEYLWQSANVEIDRSGDQRHQYSTMQYQGLGDGTKRVGNPAVNDEVWSPTDQHEVLVSWWIKFDRSIYEQVDNAAHKLIRIWGGDAQDMRLSWNSRNNIGIYNQNSGLLGSDVAYSMVDPTNLWVEDQWHHHEIWVSAKYGEVKAYVDGQLVVHLTNSERLKGEHPKGPRLTLLGWNPSHGEGFVGNAQFKLSDVTVLTSRARVLFSNEPEFKNSRHYEYQPVRTWTDNKIEFDINLGALDGESDLYIYVVNENGLVNEEGFPLKRCSDCPETVELRVN